MPPALFRKPVDAVEGRICSVTRLRCCRVFETRGVRLVTDGVSLEFVRGAKVDYAQELIKAAFEVRASSFPACH